MGLLILPIMFLLMWLLLIRPQQKKMRDQRAMLSTVTEGDEVMLSSGIYGIVTAMDHEDVWVEVSEGVEMRVVKGAIARISARADHADDPATGSDSTSRGADSSEA